MADPKKGAGQQNAGTVIRRDFLIASGALSVAAVVGGAGRAGRGRLETDLDSDLPVSQGYILVDVKKCQGCLTCMLACSLAHHGRENLSLARLQVMQNSFEKWPDDLTIEACRQCADPACIKACPKKNVLYPHPGHGNVRVIDAEKCIGCRECVDACPFPPGRALWNFEDDYAQKCDLCADAPYWQEGGGPGGKQACIELCPVKALAFQAQVPLQEGDDGYKVDLRGRAWQKMGFPED